MPRKNTTNQDQPVTDYRHSEKRKNIPPARLAGQGKVREVPRTRYSYDPHLPPVLRFDPTGNADQLPELLQIARQRALTPEEAKILADARKKQQPRLEWSGKREKDWFVVDPERFTAFPDTHTLPFATGEHKRVAVKVIDPRGNEAIRILNICYP